MGDPSLSVTSTTRFLSLARCDVTDRKGPAALGKQVVPNQLCEIAASRVRIMPSGRTGKRPVLSRSLSTGETKEAHTQPSFPLSSHYVFHCLAARVLPVVRGCSLPDLNSGHCSGLLACLYATIIRDSGRGSWDCLCPVAARGSNLLSLAFWHTVTSPSGRIQANLLLSSSIFRTTTGPDQLMTVYQQ